MAFEDIMAYKSEMIVFFYQVFKELLNNPRDSPRLWNG